MMDNDDIEAAATGEYTLAYLLAFFRLKQKTGELLANQPQPLAPEPVSRAQKIIARRAQRLKTWSLPMKPLSTT